MAIGKHPPKGAAGPRKQPRSGGKGLFSRKKAPKGAPSPGPARANGAPARERPAPPPAAPGEEFIKPGGASTFYWREPPGVAVGGEGAAAPGQVAVQTPPAEKAPPAAPPAAGGGDGGPGGVLEIDTAPLKDKAGRPLPPPHREPLGGAPAQKTKTAAHPAAPAPAAQRPPQAPAPPPARPDPAAAAKGKGKKAGGKKPGLRMLPGRKKRAPQGAPAPGGTFRLVKGQAPAPGRAAAGHGGAKGPKKPGQKRQLSEFERYKQKMAVRKKANTILGILMITLASAGLVIGFGAFSQSEFGVVFRSRFSNKTQFPLSMAGSIVRQMAPLNWDVGMVSDADLYVYDAKGNKTLEFNHGYASPVLKTAGGMLLLYDQGGNKFEVASATRALHAGVASYAIHAADIAADGTVALATSSSKHSAEVLVYDSALNQVGGTWHSSNMVTAVALSEDGKQTAVSCVSTQLGGLVSTVTLLDVHNTKDIFKIDIKEEFVYNISFKDRAVQVITDKSVKIIDTMGRVRTSYDFEGQQIMMFAHGGNQYTVLVMGNYRYMRATELVALDSRSRPTGRLSVDKSIESVKADAGGFYFLADDVVSHYDYKCKLLSETRAEGAIEYLPLGQSLYVSTYEAVKQLDLR